MALLDCHFSDLALMVGSVRLLELMRTSLRRDVTSENGPLANAEETSMTIYISQGRYTAAAIKGMSAKPEDRSEAVEELFAAAGARLISWYLTLGPYDWLIIAEAPDEPTMISAVLAAAAGGSLSDITTTVRSRRVIRRRPSSARASLL